MSIIGSILAVICTCGICAIIIGYFLGKDDDYDY